MLSAFNLVRRFGARTAVDGVTFEVKAGEVFALLGPNGAGKTTTLRMLGGLIAPTSGEVRVAGQSMNGASGPGLRARIGFLTETPGLWEQLTAADNIAVYARLFGMTAVSAAVERSLRRFDLWERRADRVALLSKGMKQKLALARALVHDPEIVLLDEPTANLDPKTSRGVRDLLLELRGRGRAVVVSTHNLDEVERLADRVALISTRLVAIGAPAALRRQMFGRRLIVRLASGPPVSDLMAIAGRAGAQDVRSVDSSISMVLDDPDLGAPAVVRALVQAGAAIRAVFDEEPPLEDVYLRLLAGDSRTVPATTAAPDA
ncbi:MAG: ABC transporter ATP-binding protein [Acidobacteriota bacterium]|nr:ABC transporter ATP-binding protein [Acidobacteriota bacterium]